MKASDIRTCINNLAISRCQSSLTDLAVLLKIMEEQSVIYHNALLKDAYSCLKKKNLDGLAVILKCWESDIGEYKLMVEHAQCLKASMKEDLDLAYTGTVAPKNDPQNDNRLLRKAR